MKTPKVGGWYAHFWDKNGKVLIAFSTGKVFSLDYYDKNTWKETIEYGLKIGIPAEQLDFTID
ncbi:MAG: hypothetical protein K2K31_02915 [Clostridia bacterium]|nr:hypothetical protein [Clostridia bacterium]